MPDLAPDRVKSLEFAQAIISRLGSNSFAIKGWSITLATAIFAFTAKESQPYYAALAFLPAIVFWVLDAYYMSLEHAYRDVFNELLDAEKRDAYNLTADTKNYLLKKAFSPAVMFVHVVPIVVAIIIIGALG
jgi:hypothetical protein